jgi:hypothetical protein
LGNNPEVQSKPPLVQTDGLHTPACSCCIFVPSFCRASFPLGPLSARWPVLSILFRLLPDHTAPACGKIIAGMLARFCLVLAEECVLSPDVSSSIVIAGRTRGEWTESCFPIAAMELETGGDTNVDSRGRSTETTVPARMPRRWRYWRELPSSGSARSII